MSSPATLFIECWKEADAASPSERTMAPKCSPHDQEAVKKALAGTDGVKASEDLAAIIAGSPNPERRLGLLLHVMDRIDYKFGAIHPRVFDVSGGHALAPWLQSAETLRRSDGVYALEGELRLIARGPLKRKERIEFASYAEVLGDRFSYLAVTSSHVMMGGRKIAIHLSHVIDEDVMHGVPSGSRLIGSEKLCAVPVAEERSHLELKPLMHGDRRFMSYGPAANFDAAAAFLGALKAAGDVDIAVAPEFVMDSASQDRVVTQLRIEPSTARLMLIGTTNTRDIQQGQPWNEAIVTNGFGAELWRQRKIWMSMIDEFRAERYGIKDFEGAGPFHEDNASGSCIEVVDIDSIGRCIVLICQDFEADFVIPLARQFQADWIFIPILDRGFATRSWFVDRARVVSNLSQARLVGVCSTALPRDDNQTVYCLSILYAARGESKGAASNAIACVQATGFPGYATHHFNVDPTDTIVNEIEKGEP